MLERIIGTPLSPDDIHIFFRMRRSARKDIIRQGHNDTSTPPLSISFNDETSVKMGYAYLRLDNFETGPITLATEERLLNSPETSDPLWISQETAREWDRYNELARRLKRQDLAIRYNVVTSE